jgi:hypothetical protein
MDSVTPPDDTSVTQTTTEYISESKLPQPNNFADCGGGNLTFPNQLSTKEVALAKIKLEQLQPELAQEILDELAGRLNANSVRSSPLSYLRSLVARAESGTFTPEAGVRVAATRERDKKLAAMKCAVRPHEGKKNTLDPREQIQELRSVISSKKINPAQERP